MSFLAAKNKNSAVNLKSLIFKAKVKRREKKKLEALKRKEKSKQEETSENETEESTLNDSAIEQFKRKWSEGAADDSSEADKNQKNPKKKKKKEHSKNESNGGTEEENIDTTDEIKEPPATLALDLMNNKKFSSLEGVICDDILKAIEDMGFTTMTEIQARCIPPLLEGRDLIGAAKTGSGKTLAFLIPALELLYKLKFHQRNGTGVIIISPTRELAIQTYGVLQELLKYRNQTYGLVMGGADRNTEKNKLSSGINVLVATPGRLLDHMQSTERFLYKNLQCLIIDEADRILDIGFEEEMKKIIMLLPKRRQTMLFSATQTAKTECLAKLALKKEPVYIGVDDEKKTATVEGLEQGYVICPSEKRLLLLFTFLKKNRKKKIMVFFSSCMSVKFHNELFNYIDLPTICIHGKQKQQKRTSVFFEFCNAETGILLCTDVAARGLDIPAVDWIVQYDPPDEPKEYVHRVGRTARGEGSKGHALLILRPEELGFLRYLKQAKVPLNEFEFSWNKVANIQPQLEKLMATNYFLNMSAKEAFKSYVRSYDAHHLKTIFDINTLDLTKVAYSFGFSVPPNVDLQSGDMRGDRKKKGFNDKKPFKKKSIMFKKATALYRTYGDYHEK